jgi:hypothetical protein
LTNVVPTGKKELDTGEHTISPHVPVETGALYLTRAPHSVALDDTVILGGQVNAQVGLPSTSVVVLAELLPGFGSGTALEALEVLVIMTPPDVVGLT